jgi:hypothetical protein
MRAGCRSKAWSDLIFDGSLEAFQRRGTLEPSRLRTFGANITRIATYFGIMIWVVAMLERSLNAREL